MPLTRFTSAVRFCSALFLGAASLTTASPALAAPQNKPAIDIVFAIDCSGSMGPVIEAAKLKVWTIVNHVATAKPSPVLRIGLIGYGNGAQSHRVFPLSEDLDGVYRDLMTFKDEGWGSEYVGLAVHKASTNMRWTSASTNLKVIYVLGNETARQGPADMDYARTTPVARKRGIIVNAIYCDALSRNSAPTTGRSAPPPVNRAPLKGAGPQSRPATAATPLIVPQLNTAETASRKEMATLGGGEFLVIGADGGLPMVVTPYDHTLNELNTRLNTTYLPYGEGGTARHANQVLQDSNAMRVGGAATASSRANAKAQVQYNNRSWDLVDASREKGFDLSKFKTSELPSVMRSMTPQQRAAHLQKTSARRTALQRQILEAGRRRAEYIRRNTTAHKLDSTNSFDYAVQRSLTRQGQSKGFSF